MSQKEQILAIMDEEIAKWPENLATRLLVHNYLREIRGKIEEVEEDVDDVG